MASEPLKITCNKECDIEFWTDDDADAELSTNFQEKKQTNRHHKTYHFDQNKDFTLNLTKSRSGTLKYKIITEKGEQQEKEYKIVKPKPANAVPAAKVAPKLANAVPAANAAPKLAKAPSVQNSCTAIHNYRNNGFSCYYDSLFFALFAFPSNFISAHLFTKKKDVDEAVFENIVTKYLHPVSFFQKEDDYCLRLPKELLINPSKANQQQDAGELLNLIFEKLKINTLSERITETTSNGIDKPKDINKKILTVVPIIPIGKLNIEKYRLLVNTDMLILQQLEKNVYSKQKHIESKGEDLAKRRDVLFQNYQRSVKSGIILQRALYLKKLEDFNAVNLPTDQSEISKFTYLRVETYIEYNLKNQNFIVLKNEGSQNTDIETITQSVNIASSDLNLNQIVCRSGSADGKSGHYVCYFRCNQNWYLYNDIEEQTIQLIGSNLKIQDGYTWTLLFYNEVKPQA